MIKNLILDMIDANTLPTLDDDEISSLASLTEENLVPFILELSEDVGLENA